MRGVPRTALAAYTVACLALGGPGSAHGAPGAAQRTEADGLAKRGAALYAEGRYAEAQAALERARALAPTPAHLYALGQIARRLNDCRRAIRHYRAFIIESTSPKEVEAARLQIERCEEVLAAEPAPPASQPTSAPAAIVAPPAMARPRPHDGVDGLAIGLAITGGVALAAGGYFTWRAVRAADGDETYGEFEASRSDRERDRLIGVGLGVGGLTLTTIAVVRWLRPTGGPTTTIVPGDGGAALVVGGSF